MKVEFFIKSFTYVDQRPMKHAEMVVSDGFTGNDGIRVPLVLLVLEGGPGTLETVYSSIRKGTPAVIVQVRNTVITIHFFLLLLLLICFYLNFDPYIKAFVPYVALWKIIKAIFCLRTAIQHH